MLTSLRAWPWLIVSTLLSLAGPTAQAEEGVQWLKSAVQAAEIARETGRPILIYVRSENCMYCDKMQQEVWQDPAAIDIIHREFVPLKLTREENQEAIEAMKVKGYPATLFFSANRTYVGRLDGYVTSQRFIEALASVRTALAQPTPNAIKR